MSRERLGKLFSIYKESTKPKTYSYNTNNDCMFHFYEWSNLKSQPRMFRNKEDFFKFLGESNIPEKNLRQELKYRYSAHITCLEGSTDIVVGISLYDLQYEYNRKMKK